MESLLDQERSLTKLKEQFFQQLERIHVLHQPPIAGPANVNPQTTMKILQEVPSGEVGQRLRARVSNADSALSRENRRKDYALTAQEPTPSRNLSHHAVKGDDQ